MEKLIKRAVLSTVSIIGIIVPFKTAVAYDGFGDYHHQRFQSHSYHHPQTHSSIQRNIHREQSTHHHYHVERNTHHHTYRYRAFPDNTGDTLAAGVLGFAAGALLGNALKKTEQPQVIYQVQPQNQIIYQAPPAEIYQSLSQQQINAWLKYCSNKYRTFNPQTGTFRGRDGLDHFCYAPLK
ncbi:BA14K family protein [Bartonella sp. F02]|uniref:BA14K family protein n=1 Tax=Bartonella sp. F02 TaxID=2967262 RepID=UPI0022A99560|nr:BA14K family protein [Bartonella sp. F02]MCZ2328705.1 BA14K family protein [Bartonella sp. F02]